MILVDNDDDAATHDGVACWMTDPRFRYVRTGGLDMVENWRAGLEHASGEFLIWMDSKTVLYPGALRRIDRYLGEHADAEAIVWNYDFVLDTARDRYLIEIDGGEDRVEPSSVVLDQFLEKRMHRPTWASLPRGVCSAIALTTVRRAEEEFDGPFFDYYSPDVVAALKVLTCADSVYYIGDVLSCVVSTKVSNGRNFGMRRQDASHYSASGRRDAPFQIRKAPLKNPNMISNLVADDIEVTLGGHDGVVYWKKWKSAYVNSVYREIGAGIGRNGLIYSRSELKEFWDFAGWSPGSYLITLRRIIFHRAIALHDALPSRAKRLIGKLRVSAGKGHPTQIVEIDSGVDVYDFIVARHAAATS